MTLVHCRADAQAKRLGFAHLCAFLATCCGALVQASGAVELQIKGSPVAE